MRSKLLVAVAAGVTLLSVAQASAAIVTITYSGTLTDGNDTYNTWGTGNTDLTGDAFSLVFTANTAIGLLQPENVPLYYADEELSGGVTAVLTINGQSEVMPSDLNFAINGQVFPLGGGPGSVTREVVAGGGNGVFAEVLDLTSSYTFPASLTTPFNIVVTGNVQGDGNFQLIGTFGDFDITDVSSVVSATPLASTWTMLIAGFLGLGFFAYRGSKKHSAALNGV